MSSTNDLALYFPFLTLILLMVLFMVTSYFMSRSRMPKAEDSKTFTLIKCENGDYVNEREFTEGDYIMKNEGKCPKDNGNLSIVGIYLKKIQIK